MQEIISISDTAAKSERQSAHRQLENLLVDIRDKWGLVSEEGRAKAKIIKLTGKGEMALDMFSFLIKN